MLDLSKDVFELEEQAYMDDKMLDSYARRVVYEYYMVTREDLLNVNDSIFLRHEKEEYVELCKRLLDRGVNLLSCFYRTKILLRPIERIENFVQSLIRLYGERNIKASITADDLEVFMSQSEMYEHIDDSGKFVSVSYLKHLDNFVIWTALNLNIEFIENEGYEAYLMLLCLADDMSTYLLHNKGTFPKFAYKFFVSDLLRMGRKDRVPLLLNFIWEDIDE